MGRMKDYLIWLEEKGLAVWNESTDEYDFTCSTTNPELFKEYQEYNRKWTEKFRNDSKKS